ncbi:HPr(Ser) kinase/phosphatase [Thiohalobacter thiocyanaticus]|uniref:HPr kinase/phosphorylase n=1 Tax=Thiohalobacter thiocyanaticus TaxID=585455 RepID=A0A426QHL3_9GAMM|nr:HPr(Ser) kinase/phosphatase [Thiohalobacter thiocyanaticus]RRQ21233.1 HPr(Ser) kinase/phosphatase [Thiohalobacter thiocyanaticus]
MSRHLTVGELFDALQRRLGLTWVSGERERSLHFDSTDDAQTGSLVGHLNFIHNHCIQIIDRIELAYLNDLEPERRDEALDHLFAPVTDAVILANIEPPADLLQAAALKGTPLLTSTQHGPELINHIEYYYAHYHSTKLVIHGVFMEVMGIGLLITGDAAIGKSELALELISRGHRLIADDSPEFAQVAPDILSGTCPPVLRDFLEVRGLGILNIRAMYGESAIKYSKYLRLIIHLQQMEDDALRQIDRLRGSYHTRRILEVEVPEITLPVAPGRNLAVLVEAAARKHILTMRGHDAGEELIQRQREQIQQTPE